MGKSAFAKLIKLFLKILYVLPVKNDQIFFMSFDGTQIGYDSRAVLEYLNQNYPDQYRFIWGCSRLDQFKNEYGSRVKLVKIKSFRGIMSMMTSKALIYNINAPMYIPFRRKQILINTWHGRPFKKIGKDAADHFNKAQVNTSTYYTSHSKRYSDILRNAFEYEGKILECGCPRNDMLVNGLPEERKDSIRKRISLGKDYRSVLLAPTFRGDFRFEDSGIDIGRLVPALEEKFGGEWELLYRLHPRVKMDLPSQGGNVIDVSQYPDMQDLLAIADILITDYSSSMWDMSLTGKPIFRFADDLESYRTERGLYEDYYSLPFPLAVTNDELIKEIREFDQDAYRKSLETYFVEEGSFERGNCCEIIGRIIR